MASDNGTALAVKKEDSVEVLEAGPGPDLLRLMADANAAEKLVPWTEEEIEKATVADLGERVRLVCSHFKFALMREHDFVKRFRKEFKALRERSRQQGRRLPVPRCPDWTNSRRHTSRCPAARLTGCWRTPTNPRL